MKRDIPVNSFLLLFSEIVQCCIRQNSQEVERQLEEIGYPLGARFLELITLRDRNSKKEVKITEFLLFIKHAVWPVLFNNNNCSVEYHTEKDYIFMIKEENSLCNRYACLPKGMKNLNCSAFTAGIIEGMLNAAGFPSRVTAVFDSEESRPEERRNEDGRPEETKFEDGRPRASVEKTIYVIHFPHQVIARDRNIKV